jgi:hypothetical protein
MKDEAAVFTAAIGNSRLCLRCASIRSDIVEERLVAVIRRLQRMSTIIGSLETCDNCQRMTLVYRLR